MVTAKDYKSELIELYEKSFNKKKIEALWEWQYLNNPIDKEPNVIVAIDDYNNKIVGAMHFTPSQFKWDNEQFEALQICNTMVHPKYRRKGIFDRMNNQSLKIFKNSNIKFLYTFPNRMATAGNLKRGWKKVSNRETFFKVVNWENVLKSKIVPNNLAKAIAKLNKIFIRDQQLLLSNEYNESEIKCHCFRKYGKNIADIEYITNPELIHMVRNKEYLLWRLDQHPINNYKYITINNDKELLGYAIISIIIGNNNYRIGQIVDFTVKYNKADYFRILINKSIIELKKEYPDHINIITNNESFKRILMKEFNFFSPLRFPFSRITPTSLPLVVKNMDNFRNKKNLYSTKNWEDTSLLSIDF